MRRTLRELDELLVRGNGDGLLGFAMAMILVFGVMAARSGSKGNSRLAAA
jgi:hypothetical protein